MPEGLPEELSAAIYALEDKKSSDMINPYQSDPKDNRALLDVLVQKLLNERGNVRV